MMKSTFCWRMLILLLPVALMASPLAAGVVFQVETTYHSGTPGTETSEMSVEKPNLKMDIASGSDRDDKGVAVFRGDRRQMVVIDDVDKSYVVIDGEAVRDLGGQMQGQMQQAMGELEKHLENLDPKQREMLEKMLKGQMPDGAGARPGAGAGSMPRQPATEVRATGERATHKGYPCVRYDVLRDGEKVQELWVTDWGNVRGGAEVAEVFQDMSSFYGELLDSFEDMLGAGGGGFFSADRNPIETLTRVDGFPVVTRDFEGGELESETVLESVTERDLDPDAFEPPKGYRLRTMGPQ